MCEMPSAVYTTHYCTVLGVQVAMHNSQHLWYNLLDLPAELDTDDGFEEVVDNLDEVGRVDDEAGLEVLPVSSVQHLVEAPQPGKRGLVPNNRGEEGLEVTQKCMGFP